MGNNQTITKLSKLAEYSKGQIVEFPEFGEGQPFVARLRRPSMLSLAKSGKIPNSLLNSATTLFNNDMANADLNETFLKEMYEVMEVICEASFVEPTYKEIVESGVELTDEQMIFVFNYSQRGVQSLNSFRSE